MSSHGSYRPGSSHSRRSASPRPRRPKAPPPAAPPAELTLGELQERVHAWISRYEEGYWPPLSMLARLTEEVGELARELNHEFGHKPKRHDEPPGDIALEVADIVFVLACLCNSLGIDLATAFERVMEKYEARDAGRWTPRRDSGITPRPAAPTRRPSRGITSRRALRRR